jgi:hypothetical protein
MVCACLLLTIMNVAEPSSPIFTVFPRHCGRWQPVSRHLEEGRDASVRRCSSPGLTFGAPSDPIAAAAAVGGARKNCSSLFL